LHIFYHQESWTWHCCARIAPWHERTAVSNDDTRVCSIRHVEEAVGKDNRVLHRANGTYNSINQTNIEVSHRGNGLQSVSQLMEASKKQEPHRVADLRLVSTS